MRPAESPDRETEFVPPTKILVVDDEPDFELLIRRRFRREIKEGSFVFRFARQGDQALLLLASDPGDLILLDINMPVMDGLSLLTELRERQSPVQAIIVSAYGDMTNLRTAMNRGAFDFVTKPVDLADLEITIRKAMAPRYEDAGDGAPAASGGAGAQQPFSLFFAQRCRTAGGAGRAARRGPS